MELACSVDPAEHRGDGGALVDAGPGAVSTTDGGPRDGGLFDGGPSDAGLLDGGASAPDAGGAPPWVPTGYRLVWADEFDGPGSLPDATKWVYDTEANATGWYNHELQYYAVARPESSRVTGGHLIITARKERLTSASDYGGQNYSSARLITRGKSSWTYGFVDVRAKLPCGVGTWPAIWMLGTSGAWPAGGEIDIMEQVGKTPTTIYGTVHCQATAGTSGNGGSTNVTDACAAFHNYHVLWTPERLDFGVDGVVFHSYLNQGLGHDSWPFNEPQYLLLNLAIGGDMAGSVDDSIFPVEFQVDSARVYQKP
jgi:beta-glucanase (GH16 family)